MKKLLCILLTLVLLVGSLSGCGNKNDNEGKISIVTTVFPIYDWVVSLLGDRVDGASVTMLLDSGVDLHSYQPTVDDLVTISSCDLFIYVGGESDEWVEDALSKASNKDMQVINLVEALGEGAKEEEAVNGEEHHHDHEGDEHHHEVDEHVWLSLKNAKLFCRAITDKLSVIDADGKDAYEGNYAAYAEKLDTLDAGFKSAVDSAAVKTLVFADRFPFRYLVDDYGIDYFAAFSGCSAETEASFETIAFLAGKIDELGLKSVLTIEGSDSSIAKTVIEATAAKNAQILTMDSMQSSTSEDVKKGVTYLSGMEKNLDVFKNALK